MRVLFITRKYPPMVGGMEQWSFDYYNHIKRKSRVYLIKWGYSQKWLPIFLLYAFFKALAVLSSKKIDIIQLGDPVLSGLGYVLKVLFNKPVVVSCHGYDVVYNNLIHNFHLRHFFSRLDKAVCNSHETLKNAVKKGISEKKCVFVPVGIDTERFYYSRSKNKMQEIGRLYGVNLKNKTILLSVGRLIRRKGAFWFLANVFPRLDKGFVYFIVGEGPDMAGIKKFIKRHGLQDRVRAVGAVHGQGLIDLYRVSDIFLMPNIKVKNDAEGFGIVPLEASAIGLPVIASSLEGIKDSVIDGRNGYSVRQGDAVAYVNKIYEASNKDILSRKFSNYTRVNFSWDRIISKYIKVYEDLT